MTKKRSKCLFTLFAILLVICLIATFVNFTYPFTIKGNYYSYSNFVSNLKLGEDIGTGLRLTYRADLPENELEQNYDALYAETIEDLKEIIQSQGFKDVTVAAAENNQIIVNVGNILNEEDENEVVSLIGDMSQICFSMEASSEKAFATASDVESIEILNTASDRTYYYVRINFKSSSLSAITEATKDGGTLSIMLGETAIGQMDIESSTLSNGVLDIYSQDFVDEAAATTYANKLRTGTFALQLVQLNSATISPSYGIGANIFVSVAVVAFVIAAFVYLIIKYKHLGWLSCFALLFYWCIGLFLLQSIPLVHINFAGIIGMLIAFAILVDTLINIFEKTKTHYQSDVKLFVAIKMAQRETLIKTIISNVTLMIIGLICLFMPVMSVQSFGWVVFVLSFVSTFISLVLMKLFIKMYLPFNSVDGKKCNFHKGGKNA